MIAQMPVKQYWGRSWYKYTLSYQDFYYKDKTVSGQSYLYDGNPHTWRDRFILRWGTGDYGYIDRINSLATHDITQQNKAKHNRVHTTGDILQ